MDPFLTKLSIWEPKFPFFESNFSLFGPKLPFSGAELPCLIPNLPFFSPKFPRRSHWMPRLELRSPQRSGTTFPITPRAEATSGPAFPRRRHVPAVLRERAWGARLHPAATGAFWGLWGASEGIWAGVWGDPRGLGVAGWALRAIRGNEGVPEGRSSRGTCGELICGVLGFSRCLPDPSAPSEGVPGRGPHTLGTSRPLLPR